MEATLNINYAIKIASLYVSDMVLIENCFVKFNGFRGAFLWTYIEFVRDGFLPAIEKLDPEVKKNIYDTSLEWEPSNVDKKVRIELCRCIWCLNYVLEKYLKV